MSETLERIFTLLEEYTTIPVMEELAPMYEAINLSCNLSLICIVSSGLTIGLVLGVLFWGYMK